MGTEVDADQLGEEWKGYILRIAGGNDKQGFPMKQGVLTHSKFFSLFFLYHLFIVIDSKLIMNKIHFSSCTPFIEEGTLMLSSTSYR